MTLQLRFRPPTDLLNPSACSPLSSCMVSPSLESVSEDSGDDRSDMDYFGRGFVASPGQDSASDADSEGAESDDTLEDADIFAQFGYPLERVPRHGGNYVTIAPEPDSEFLHAVISGSSCPSCSVHSPLSSPPMTSSLTSYQEVIGDLVNVSGSSFDELDPQNFVTYDPSPSTSFSSLPPGPLLMIKRVPRNSVELSILLDLNSSELRKDPWNPSPHILQVVDHDPNSEYVYQCMERLNEYNAPAMTTVAQYIDFFRQVLEGLSFLHEHNLACFSCSDPSSYMVDLSSGPLSTNASSVTLAAAPTTPSRGQGTPTTLKVHSGHRDHNRHHCHRRHLAAQGAAEVRFFDRSMYPVRYYFVNFSRTRRIPDDDAQSSLRDRTTSTTAPTLAKRPFLSALPQQLCPFKQDVKDLGTMFDRMVDHLPAVVGSKFKALIKAMTMGGFGAEDSRKLFEALCRSLEAEVFEMPVKVAMGMRSRSIEVLTTCGNMTSASGGWSPGGPLLRRLSSKKLMGDFGLEPEKVALSS